MKIKNIKNAEILITENEFILKNYSGMLDLLFSAEDKNYLYLISINYKFQYAGIMAYKKTDLKKHIINLGLKDLFYQGDNIIYADLSTAFNNQDNIAICEKMISDIQEVL